MRSNIHVLIAHDCLFAAECLAIGLTADPHICVAHVAEAEAVATATDQLPDIVLIYLTSPWPAPLRLAGEINAQTPASKIILLGVPLGENYILDCIKTGAKGWLHKSTSLREVHLTLKNINEGHFIYSPRLTNSMFRCLCELAATGPLIESLGSAALTAREIQVMELLAEDKSNQQIAARLHLSVHTVKKHVHNLLAKLQVCHRDQLVQTADVSRETCE